MFYIFRTLHSGVRSYLNQSCAPEGLITLLGDRTCITEIFNNSRRDVWEPVSGTSVLRSHRFQGSWINLRRRRPAEQSRVTSTLPLHFPDSLSLHLKLTDRNSGSRAHTRCPICLLLQGGQNTPPPALVSCPRFCKVKLLPSSSREPLCISQQVS